MGRHKFRLSDMIPNAWFFKLRDMRAARGTGAASPGAASRAGRPPSTPRRTSYYYSPRAGDPVGSPLHPRASDTQFPPLPLSPPRRSSSKRRHRRRPVKLAPSVSGSSVLSSPVSTGCRCRRKPELVAVQAPDTPPCRRDRFVGYNDDSPETLKKPTVTVDELHLNGKVITSATDIIIDLRTKKNKTLLPPIVTKPARTTPNGCELEDKHIDIVARATQRTTAPFSDEQQSKVVVKPRRSASSSARRLKTRGNTPRVASSRKPKPPAPAPAPSPARTKPPPPASPTPAAAPGPPRPQFAASPAYMTPPASSPSPAFSYNVLPRAPPPRPVGSGAAHQQAPMAPPMPPAALQPPAPRPYFGNRPSFSYNVASHANASLPTGQQFQLDTGMNHSVQVPMFARPASLQPPAPGQLPRPSGPFPGAMAPNPLGSIRLPFPVPPRTSNILYGANPQQGNPDVSVSKSDVPSAPEASPHTMQSLPPRPEVFGTVEGSAPGQSSSNLSTPPSLLGRPTTPSAPSLPQASPSGAVPRTAQQQFYPSHPSAPGIVPPQPLWGYPTQPTSFQQAPFYSYPPGPLGPLGRPMIGTSAVTTSLTNIQPPGITTGGDPKEPPSTNPGSVQPIHSSVEPHPTGLEHKSTTGIQDSDAWSAHKTEAGVLYYYNALTGESTYQRPPGYKGELEKVAAQPIPASWDKISGTDWSIVTTSDGKKYYYDNKQKISSWQLPPEVAELNKNADSGSLKGSSTSLQEAGTIGNKGEISGEISTPAIQTGGRDSLPLRQTVVPASPSALDLIKKKLQDAGAFSVSSPLATPSSTASELNGSKPAEGAPKGQQGSNNGEKSKDNSGNENISDSSSDSDDEEHGPSKDDCIREFKEMLKERGVAPFSKWEKELPKLVFDSRFKAIPSHSTRRAIFDHFVRTRADEERKEKRAAQKAVVEAFKHLLEEASEDIDPKMGYQEFERKRGTDPRFEALDRKEREALFKEKVRAIEEKFQSARNAVITDFKSMLRECKDIISTSRWTKVKEKFRSDPRYKAVKQEERENAFNEYIAELKSAEREVEQAAKAKVDEQAKLRERERETRKRKEREEQEMERVKLKIRRKDAESSYQALLVEIIKDPKASWTESKPKLEKDPQGRALNPDLGQGDAEKLFRDHVKDLYERCVRDFRALLSEAITPEIATQTTDEGKTAVSSWSEAKGLLRSDPRYNKVASKDRESIWRRYVDDMARKLKKSDTEKPDTDARQQHRSSDLSRRR